VRTIPRVLRISLLARRIKPFLVMELLDSARILEKEKAIYHLEVGEPDLPTPEPIIQRTISALMEKRTHYTVSLGEIALREAIVQKYAREGIEVDPDQILVSNGSSPLLYASLLAVVDPGDEVILTDPTYPCYPNFVTMVGGRIRWVPLSAEKGFRPEIQAIRRRITPRTRAILINSPQNPSGVVLTKEELEAIADLGIWVIVDEIYRGIEYDLPSPSALTLKRKNIIVVDGFSKRYAMTGFRLGYMIMPEPLVPVLKAIHQNLMISANEFVQWGGVSALLDPEVEKEIQRWILSLKERRDLLLEGLKELAIAVPALPQGAFYLLADFRFTGRSGLELARELLEGHGIALTPGEDFGKVTRGFLRMSFATSAEDIQGALRTLRRWKGGI
jgi:aspartate/methionine/tyrosine aminotransferase